ncbi:MAG TPA: DegT/DnrJ/EryC1/StrS family aminotransferase [Gemmatimonadales bacterium]|nr:DegT/DnrJ/EryC1/StrS family aminotransferase [Gemmatimonadales bacterium]
MLRRQLPAHAPLTWPVVATAAAGLGARGRSGNEDAYDAVRELLAHHFSARAVVLTNSGTSALQLALGAASAEVRGGAVALPAYCCYDVATAAVGAGLPVLFYDVDFRTLGPNLGSLDDALRRGARVILVAHLFGIPADVEAVRESARRVGAIVVEDAAQGFGATIGQAPLGSMGSLGVLSFGRGKGATAGRGGALLATDEVGTRVLHFVESRLGPPNAGWGDFARILGQWVLGRPTVYGVPAALPFLHLGETVYRQPEPPGSLSPVAARALLAVWPLALREVEARRRTAVRWREFIRGSRFLPIEPLAGAHPSYLRFPALAPVGEALHSLPVRFGAARAYPQPLSELLDLRRLRLPQGTEFPGARTLASRLCTLPTHSRLSETDVQALSHWIARSQ